MSDPVASPTPPEPVAISAVPLGQGNATVFALLNDGSIWVYQPHHETWRVLPPVPTTAKA